ncbi:MAG TPA: EamA family transporter [Actinomycetota bacterium]|nr:EamA family transporter [Actinomycetota bacterium]
MRIARAPARGVPPALVWGPLGAVYLIWGTTYLAIRIVNQTLPPLLAAAVRFLVAGAVLSAWAVRRGDRAGDRPGPRQWLAALGVGALLLFGGNGGVVWAERTVPSGVVALIIALVPLWMALIDRVVYRRHLAARAWAGIVLGFGGAGLLVGPDAGGRLDLPGVLVALGASLSWAGGSIFSRQAPLPRRPLVGNGMQMLAGGALLGTAGLLAGELDLVRPERFSAASLWALAYLIVFGSFVAFTSYLWLLRAAPTSLVATYAYVTPVVAVFLGWLVLDEPVGVRTVAAAAVIVVAVALIVSARAEPPPPDVTSGEELDPAVRRG